MEGIHFLLAVLITVVILPGVLGSIQHIHHRNTSTAQDAMSFGLDTSPYASLEGFEGTDDQGDDEGDNEAKRVSGYAEGFDKGVKDEDNDDNDDDNDDDDAEKDVARYSKGVDTATKPGRREEQFEQFTADAADGYGNELDTTAYIGHEFAGV